MGFNCFLYKGYINKNKLNTLNLIYVCMYVFVGGVKYGISLTINKNKLNSCLMNKRMFMVCLFVLNAYNIILL